VKTTSLGAMVLYLSLS